MRPLATAVSAVLLAAVPALAQPGRDPLRSQYDALESCTTVNVSVFRYGPGGGRNVFTLDAQAMHLGKVPPPRPIPEATFLFREERGPDQDTFGGDDPALSLLLDDSVALRYRMRPARPFPAQHLRGGTLERLYARIPAADLRRMAGAARIRGKIGDQEFTLDGARIATLRLLSDFMARSPSAPVPVPGGLDARDCDSYPWSPNFSPYKPEAHGGARR